MATPLRTLCTVAFILLPALAASGRAQCPFSTYSLFGIRDSTTAESITIPIQQRGNSFGRLRFDLRTGTASGGVVENDAIPSAVAKVDAVDRYRVLGLADGTPVSITARVHGLGSGSALATCGHGSAGSSVYLEPPNAPRMSEGAGRECGSYSFDRVVAATIATVAGQEFTLRWGMSASAWNGDASASATLSFDGLPSGARVESCQGFVGNGPVPVHQSSWGATKIRYR